MGSRVEQHLKSGSSYVIDGRLERQGGQIFLERNYVCHPEIARARSVLLPDQHLWVMFFEGHEGAHPCRCYMHMAMIADHGDAVIIDDLYLDVLVAENGRWQLVDVDEFRAALAAGELTGAQVQAALLGLENACRLVDAAGPDIERYLTQALARGRA